MIRFASGWSGGGSYVRFMLMRALWSVSGWGGGVACVLLLSLGSGMLVILLVVYVLNSAVSLGGS